jgi:DNA-binding response OmpR family regulator
MDTKKHILIVDDDKSILLSLSRVLIKNGYAVDTAGTAGEALELLKNRHFDLALIDVVLPDMRGTDLLGKAKAELKQTVKFIITGYPSGEIGAKAREEGADAFILKPIKMTELLSIIRVFLEPEETRYPEKEEEKYTLSEVGSDFSSQA